MFDGLVHAESVSTSALRRNFRNRHIPRLDELNVQNLRPAPIDHDLVRASSEIERIREILGRKP